jgi:hypothetical protein
LQLIKDSSELNRILLGGDHSVVAGRIAGGLRAVGRTDLAAGVALLRPHSRHVDLYAAPGFAGVDGPDGNPNDQRDSDALAARGHYAIE